MLLPFKNFITLLGRWIHSGFNYWVKLAQLICWSTLDEDYTDPFRKESRPSLVAWSEN